MKRTGIIAAVAGLSAVLVVGLVSTQPDARREPDTLASEPEATGPRTRPTVPKLAAEVRAGRDEFPAESSAPERSLARLEQEAREVSARLGQERDAAKREKLERYARAIEEMREGLH